MNTGEAPTTDVVKINPQGEFAYLALQTEAQKLKAWALSFVVNNPDTVKAATQDLVLTANLKKAIESLRKEYVDPLNSHVKAINATFKPLTDVISEADTILRGKIGIYNTEQQRIQAERENVERLRREAEEAAAKLAQEIGETPPSPVALATPLPISQEQRRVDTELGGMNTRKVPKWELVDFAQVPNKYKILNEVMVGKLVRAGEQDIPGIRIWQDDEIVIRSKTAPANDLAPGETMRLRDIPF